MAFVTRAKRGHFEVRESRSTPKGPRSRTLATFDEFSDEVVERARARAAKAPTAEELRRAARRAGAPVAKPPVERAARELVAELAKGRRPSPALRRMLLDLLRDREGGIDSQGPAEAMRGVAEWMAATPERRGAALVDLLLLADALPHGGKRKEPLHFPRLDSSRS